MAHIRKMTDKPRTLPWRAHINRKGHKPLVKMFLTKQEATHWSEEQERSLRLVGLPLTIDDLKKKTVGDLVQRYLTEITPTKGCRVSETTVLNKFLRNTEISAKSLPFFTRADAYSYIKSRHKDTWRGKPITARTVRREINSIQHVFEVAKEEWGLTNLINPFRGIRIKGSEFRRTRRLVGDEITLLENATDSCRGLNRLYVRIAIYLAITTGMRLQEIFNLTWADVDFQTRRVEIRKSKTDHISGHKGRTIVFPIVAMFYMSRLCLFLFSNGLRKRRDDPVFPMTRGAFKQSWSGVVKRAGIRNLTFHDLRHEAGSNFDAAGLTKGEHDLMMGHPGRDMASLYIQADLGRIQDKLDRHELGGRTYAEGLNIAKAKGYLKIPPALFERAGLKTLPTFKKKVAPPLTRCLPTNSPKLTQLKDVRN